jgi:hypothetical protein
VGRRLLPWRPRARGVEVPDVPLDGFADGLVLGLLLMVVALLAGVILPLAGIFVVLALEWLLVASIARRPPWPASAGPGRGRCTR